MNENEKDIQENEVMKKGMKRCKTCGSPIAKNAKVCPKCGAKQKGGIGKIIIIAVAVLILLSLLSGGKKDQKAEGHSEPAATASTETGEIAAEADGAEEEIEYAEYSMTQLMADLENNAAAANDTHNGQYVILTGKLSNIDAQGAYISIADPEDDFAIMGCTCYINGNEEISNVVKTLSKGDIISVKGKIKEVGEVMGYSLDIEEIITE